MSRRRGIRKLAQREEGGQVLPLVAFAMIVLIGCAAIVIDVGRLYVAKEQLQNAVNAAALVASQDLPNAGTAYTAALQYGGAPGEQNALGDGITATTPSVTFECDALGAGYVAADNPQCNYSGSQCTSTAQPTPPPNGCNAVVITETATVKTTLAGFVLHSWTITSKAVAGERAQSLQPQHVEVILDNTESMNDDDNCTVDNNEGVSITSQALDPTTTPSSLDCAKAGMRTLLQTLLPCSPRLASCSGQSPVDEVGELVFPAINTSDTSPSYAAAKAQETDCNGDTSSDHTAPTDAKFGVTYPTWHSYSYSASSPVGGIPTTSGDDDVYQGFDIAALENTYRAGGASTIGLTLTDPLVESVDWGQCPARSWTTTTNTTTTETTTTTHTTTTGTGPTRTTHTTTTTNTTTVPYTLTSTTSYAAGDYPGGNFYGLKAYGGAGTSLAGVITEAQYDLAVNAQPGVQNVIVLLSDGQVNNSSSDCTNAESAAGLAEAANTTIYVIGYGDDTGSTDCTGNVSPSTLLKNIATSGDYIDAPSGSSLTAAFQQAGDEINAGASELLSS